MTDPIVTTTYKTVRVKYTNYGDWQYFASFAVSFGYRAVPTNDKNCKVVRIWFDNVLVYDVYQNIGDVNFVFYPGTEDQPFYRGQMVLFFGRAILAEGAGIPAVTAEIVDNTPLGSVVGTVTLGRTLTPAWGEYSIERGAIVEVANDAGRLAFRNVVTTTNSDGGTHYVSDTADLAQPVIFAPWYNFALAQSGTQKRLVDTSRASAGVVNTLDGLPATVMGIAQNAGRSFSPTSTFFLLSSDVSGGKWPYQLAYIVNNKLVVGPAGQWDNEPVCLARGERIGTNVTTIGNQLSFGNSPSSSTGDVLAAFDYSVRRITVTGSIAPAATDTEIYSHDPSVGKIVRLYNYNLNGDLAEANNPIILLIETDAATHAGFIRKIAYDGTILWDSAAVELDSITDKQFRAAQTSADLTTNKLGIVSAHTPGAYTVVNLSTGELATGTFTGVTIDPAAPSLWVGAKETFYPLLVDNKYVRIDVPGTTAIPLADAITDLAMRAGYAEADVIVSGLTDITVQGYIVGSGVTLSDILDNMSTLYQFSYAEVGNSLYVTEIFSGEAFTSVLTVDPLDMAVLTEGSNSDQQIVNSVLADDASMPLSLSVNYIDPDTDYQQGTQTARRSNVPVRTTQSDKSSTFTIPIITTGADMLMRLYRALYATWAAQKTHTIRLPPKYLALIPTDGFTFSALGFEHKVTAVSVTINADFSVTLNTAERSGSNRAPTVTTQVPDQPAPRGPLAPIHALLLDLPDTSPTQDADDTLNLGVALSGYAPGQWSSGRLEMVTTANPSLWATRLQTQDETPIGTVIEIARDTRSEIGPFETDYKTTITLALGAIPADLFATATYDQMLAGANLIAIGRDGRFELMQFGEYTDNGDGTATISTLFRGRFGTDPLIPMLSVGDYVVPYDKLNFITYPLADFLAHASYAYRGVVPGQNPQEATQALVLPNGNSYRLRAPVHIVAVRDGEAAPVDFRWLRRSRFNGGLTEGSGAIPDEGRVFSIDLYRADQTGIAYRVGSFDTSADDYDHYTFSADQIANAGYFTDASEFYVYVYQVDAAHVGRGWGGGFKVPVLAPNQIPQYASITGTLGRIGGSGAVDITAPNAATIGGTLGAIFGAAAVDDEPVAMTISGALRAVVGASAVVDATVTNARVTAVAAEVLRFPSGTKVRVTRASAEVLRRPPANLRATAVAAEVLWLPTGGSLDFASTTVVGTPTTGTGTVSAAMPTGVASGDLLLAHVTTTGSGAFSPPAGWALVASGAQTNIKAAVYSRTAGGSEPSTYDFGVGSGIKGLATIVKVQPTAAGDNGTPAATVSGSGSTTTSPTVSGHASVYKPMGQGYAFISSGNALSFTDPNGQGLALDYQADTGTAHAGTAGTDVAAACVHVYAYGGAIGAQSFTGSVAASFVGIAVSMVSTLDFS